MFQQTKVHEKTRPLIVSDKERENCICQNFQYLSYWNRYFVIYPHKCTLDHLKKKYQEKWENAYVTVKNTRASRALRRALDPSQYWLALLARLCFATSAKSRKKFLGPPLDQILDPLVIAHSCYFKWYKKLQSIGKRWRDPKGLRRNSAEQPQPSVNRSRPPFYFCK